MIYKRNQIKLSSKRKRFISRQNRTRKLDLFYLDPIITQSTKYFALTKVFSMLS